MVISEIMFIGAKYHDVECGLYLDELPEGYEDRNGDIFNLNTVGGIEFKTNEIVSINNN